MASCTGPAHCDLPKMRRCHKGGALVKCARCPNVFQAQLNMGFMGNEYWEWQHVGVLGPIKLDICQCRRS